MSKKIIAILMSAITIGLSACGGGGDETVNKLDLSTVAGNWTGTYAGADTGSVSITIASSGTITGTGSISSANFTITSGQVATDGTVTANTSNGAKLSGTINATQASGTWVNGTNTGTWTANKQSASSPFQGTWSVDITGQDTGKCAALVVSSTGALSGTCSSNSLGGAIYGVAGSVTDTGNVTVAATTGASSLSGTMSTNGIASGNWTNPTYNISGTWTATKK
jgi:hypothetical protein